MSDSIIRVGILGLGRAGWLIHANALAKHEHYRVVAVADPVSERREEARQRFGCAVFGDPEPVAAHRDVDVVVVATPSHTHAPLAVAALNAGKHVVVEKPMAQNTAEVDEMIAASLQAKRILTCFQPRRFDADFVAIRQLIASGRLGRIVMIRRGAYTFQRRADWQMLRKYGGGELSNIGAHLLDQVLQLLDNGPLELFADLQHTIGAGDAEDHFSLALKSRSGTFASIEVTRCCAVAPQEWLVMGTLGGLLGSRTELKVRWLDPDTLDEVTVDEGPAAGRKYGTPEELLWQEEILRPRQERPQVRIFYDGLRATLQTDASLLITPESIRRQMEVVERARNLTGLL